MERCTWQARQAYLIGNKALAKELSIKGQAYNSQMKAAHEKAREAIYRQRLLSPLYKLAMYTLLLWNVIFTSTSVSS